jgi:hypothetical protein
LDRLCRFFEEWPQNYRQALISVEKAWTQEVETGSGGKRVCLIEWVTFLESEVLRKMFGPERE